MVPRSKQRVGGEADKLTLQSCTMQSTCRLGAVRNPIQSILKLYNLCGDGWVMICAGRQVIYASKKGRGMFTLHTARNCHTRLEVGEIMRYHSQTLLPGI